MPCALLQHFHVGIKLLRDRLRGACAESGPCPTSTVVRRRLDKIDHKMNERALPVIMNRSSASGQFACRI
jgi:hypothetical protein